MKKLSFLPLLSICGAILFSCEPMDGLNKGNPNPTPAATIPTKAPDPTGSRQVVLYYPSYARYGADFTAGDLLSKAGAGQDYEHDIFVPSFCVIGDGQTKIGSESSAWKKNEVAFDDIYAWGGLSWDSNGYLVFANGQSIGSGSIAEGLNKYPNIAYGLAIGGWPAQDNPNDPLRTAGFDRLGAIPNDLTAFVDNVDKLDELKRITRVLNGIHIDYEFPLNTMQGGFLTKICQALYAKVGTKNTINVAVGPNIDKHLAYLDFAALNNSVHKFEIMSYDYNGKWSNITGHHTNLFSAEASKLPANNANFSTNFSVDAEVTYMLSKGVPASKIKIGVALYGRFWTGVTFPTTIDPSKPYFTATNSGLPSGVSSDDFLTEGIIKYNKILTEITPAKGWELFTDPTTGGAFAINRTLSMFVSYDSHASIMKKAAYVKSFGLGGVIVWDATGAKGTTILKQLSAAIK